LKESFETVCDILINLQVIEVEVLRQLLEKSGGKDLVFWGIEGWKFEKLLEIARKLCLANKRDLE